MNSLASMCAALGACIFLSGIAVAAEGGRDYITIVGSSTVYPFTTVVAEQFGKAGKYKTPKVESTGTGGGIKLFCSGIGAQFPDVVNASRAIKKSEIESCQKNNVKEIVEVKIGFDGIVLAHAKQGKAFDLTRREVFLALAKKVPDPKCAQTACDKLVENPYKQWKDINAALPASKIEVLGPPPTSGTRDAFAELALEGGCKSFPWMAALKDKDEEEYKKVCHSVREDGAYVEAGENDNLIVQKLDANPNAIGVFGYSFLEQNADKITGMKIDGVEPAFETIANASYSVSRPLYFYVKKAHVGLIPGIDAFVVEFTSEKAWGDDGYLAERGLVPLPQEDRKAIAAAVRQMKPMSF